MTVLLAGTNPTFPPGPKPPPPVVYVPPVPMRQTLVGWDGVEWVISSTASPVRLKKGVRGLEFPVWSPYLSKAPGLAGARYRGESFDVRDVFLPLAVAGGTGQAWYDLDTAFARILRPDRLVRWTVTLPNGQSRYLDLRFRGDGAPAMDIAPGGIGWAMRGYSFAAEQPFWSGPPVELLWENRPDPTPPYPRPGQHDPYVLHLTNGRTLSSATVTNAGDVEAYPVWTLTGPFDTAAVGVDGRQVQLPFGLLAGESVVLDADPAQLVATRSDGLDLTALLGEADWSAVPPGESVPLSLEMVGAGSVALSLAQRYYRAW